MHLKAVLLVTLSLFTLTGCAAVQHRNLETKVQMQQSIIIDPDVLADKPIYIKVTNQTGKSDLNFDMLVAQKLSAKGYKLTKNSKAAGLRILANFLYLDKSSKDMSSEGALAGGFGGAFSGNGAARAITSGSDSSIATTGMAGAVGSALGAITGSLVTVDKYLGIIDIQVEQPLQRAVTKHTKSTTAKASVSGSKQRHTSSIGTEGSASFDGSGEASEMVYEETATRKQNRTRIAAEAVQTNIDEKAAAAQIKEHLADAIAGFL